MLRDVFWTFLLRNGGEMVKTVYVKKSTAFKMVYDEYEFYAAISVLSVCTCKALHMPVLS